MRGLVPVRRLPLYSGFVGALALLLAGCAATDVETEGRNFQVQQTAAVAGAGNSQAADIQALVASSGPSYVTLVVSGGNESGVVVAQRERRKSALTSGSGFVVDHSGYVMTAAHVAVKRGNSVQARAANGRIYSGDVVAILPDNDMALIKLRGYAGKAVTPAPTRCVAPGAMVYSLGRPHAQGDTARIGQIESHRFGRPVRYGNFGYPDAMVLRMSTQKGESGGPLFDNQGQLMGMVVSTLFDGAGRPLNLAHAVPLEKVASFLCSNLKCSSTWTSAASQPGCGGA